MVHALRQPAQCQCSNKQAEVTQRDVVETRQNQQVEDDSCKPGGHNVCAHPWRDGHQDAGGDFDDTDDVHGHSGVARNDGVETRRQIDRPVGEHVGELVQAEQNGRNRKNRSEQKEGLVNGVLDPVVDCRCHLDSFVSNG